MECKYNNCEQCGYKALCKINAYCEKLIKSEIEKHNELSKCALERDKLKAQIEKMKCCLNCEHHFKNALHYICCNLREPRKEPITDRNVCNKWEKEKEYVE